MTFHSGLIGWRRLLQTLAALALGALSGFAAAGAVRSVGASLIAGYTWMPLVTIPLKDLKPARR